MASTSIVDRNRLQDLLGHRAEWCVSLFMPTDRTGAQAQRDRIQLKNLLRDAATQLQSLGMAEAGIEALLAPVAARLDDVEYWRGQQDGLGIFLAPGFERELRLPITPRAQCNVAATFTIKPLLPLLQQNDHFYVLALSHNLPRLFVATRDSIAQLDVPGMPPGIDQALLYDNQARPQASQLPTEEQGKQADERFALFHGQGGGFDGWRKSDLLRWFRMVDAALHAVLAGQEAPLVVHAVEYLRPIWREANTYPGLLEAGIDGNPDRVDPDELRGRAFALVEPLLQADIDRAKERFGDLSATDRVAVDVRDTVPAASFGRVDTLFVQRGAQVWGRFDADNNRLDVHGDESREPGDVDLLDLAARETMRNGGCVYALDKSQMPNSKPVAAVLRY